MRAFHCKYHYVASNGSSGYAYDGAELAIIRDLYEEQGIKVAVFECIEGEDDAVDNEDS